MRERPIVVYYVTTSDIDLPRYIVRTVRKLDKEGFKKARVIARHLCALAGYDIVVRRCTTDAYRRHPLAFLTSFAFVYRGDIYLHSPRFPEVLYHEVAHVLSLIHI